MTWMMDDALKKLVLLYKILQRRVVYFQEQYKRAQQLMDFQPTKQVPGQPENLPQQILSELAILNPRYKKEVTFFGGHPLSVTKKDQNQIFDLNDGRAQSPYLVCQKTDGVRYLCIVTSQCQYLVSREGSKKLVSYRSNCQMAKNWHHNPQGQFKTLFHILDGEMINDSTPNGDTKLKYLIFDALVIFGKKIIDRPLRDRLALCQKFVRCNDYLLGQLSEEDFPSTAIQVKLKDFFRLSCNTYASSQVMRKRNLQTQPTTLQFLQYCYMNALPHQHDGLIFNHDQKPYLLGPNNGYLKWKPAQLNTVDFLMIPNKNLDSQLFHNRIVDLYLGWRDAQSQIANVYKMMFYNFTIVSEKDFKDLQMEWDKKYEILYQQNPNLVTEDNFGIIAECRTQKVEVGSKQAHIFKELLSSSIKPEVLHEKIMRPQNYDKQIEVIKKLQESAYTKLWKIFRIRKDKSMPNNHDVVTKIEQSIKDDIKFSDLVQKNRALIDKNRRKI